MHTFPILLYQFETRVTKPQVHKLAHSSGHNCYQQQAQPSQNRQQSAGIDTYISLFINWQNYFQARSLHGFNRCETNNYIKGTIVSWFHRWTCETNISRRRSCCGLIGGLVRQMYQEDDNVVVSSVDFVREMYQEDGCVAFSSVDFVRQIYQEDDCVVIFVGGLMRQIYQEDDCVSVSSVDFVREMYQKTTVFRFHRWTCQTDKCIKKTNVLWSHRWTLKWLCRPSLDAQSRAQSLNFVVVVVTDNVLWRSQAAVRFGISLLRSFVESLWVKLCQLWSFQRRGIELGWFIVAPFQVHFQGELEALAWTALASFARRRLFIKQVNVGLAVYNRLHVQNN